MNPLIHVTAWEKVSLWRRIPCAFARVAALLAILTVLFELIGPPITIFLIARWEAKKGLGVEMVPRRLEDYSVSNAPGTSISYFGYEFEVPWKSTFRVAGIGKNGIVQLRFETGQIVTLIAPKNYEGLFREIVEDKSLNVKNLRPAFGDLLQRSPYDQYAALLNTTPQSIRPFGPRAEAFRGEMLLTIKAIATPYPGLMTGVFSFEFPGKRGFQIGDPQRSERVDLEVFGTGNQYAEIFCGSANRTFRFTQPQINRILTSLHRVSAEPSAARPPQIKD